MYGIVYANPVHVSGVGPQQYGDTLPSGTMRGMRQLFFELHQFQVVSLGTMFEWHLDGGV